MLCNIVRENLHVLSDGERLPLTQQLAVWRHCFGCADCRAARRGFRLLRRTTRRLPNRWLFSASALRHRVTTELLLLSCESLSTQQGKSAVPNRNMRKKQMTRITIATLAFVVPVITATVLAHKQRTLATETSMETIEVQFDVIKPKKALSKQTEPEVQRPDEASNAEFRARIMELRTQWEDWAREHQADLSQMLWETGDQRAAFDRVMQQMPQDFTPDNPFTEAELYAPRLRFEYVPSERNFRGRIRVRPNTKGYLLRDGDDETYRRWQADKKMDEQFPRGSSYLSPEAGRKQFHDIQIVTTMKFGRSYSLWISGCVTEMDYGKVVAHSGEVLRVPGEQMEIAPPYAFLTTEPSQADRDHLAQANAALNDPQATERFFNRIQELRGQWKPWAMKHRQELAAMLQETGTQHLAFDHVIQLIRFDAMNHGSDAVILDADLDSRGIPFAYVPPKSSIGLHDIKIITTMKTGNALTLWASGRVTEEGNISGRTDEFRQGIIREVLPPFAELKVTK